MKKIIFASLTALLLIITSLNAVIPNTVSVFSDQPVQAGLDSYPFVIAADTTNDTTTAKLFGVIPIKKVKFETYRRTKLSPGGDAFGIKFFTDGLIVIGISDVKTTEGSVSPAKQAGISAGDIIKEYNGQKVENSDAFVKLIEDSKGESADLLINRAGTDITLKLKPVLSQETNTYKAGLWVRDSTAGIGTVTFVDGDTNIFAGLGHGICDTDTGVLMPLGRAAIVDVTITGITKGQINDPGELKGSFSSVREGFLTANTHVGVFGLYDKLPKSTHEPIEIGLRSEVEPGEAYIYSTLGDGEPQKYKIEIVKINKLDSDTKNMLIKVTDERLLAETGGIVQGMSGSPIIQNGKLIGAVTHVLINDPTKGYGIFIENMLEKLN
ncbi:MAG: SpoIVB peptidase [Eubacteriales bacterium]|nr:SpoIVB peptidase [Eubacteriales bacterium]MDD4475853.1 SpoIVB peptidase [Eubacteriales bacterium]